MNQGESKEERAFEALIVDALRKGEQQDVCIDRIREPNEIEIREPNEIERAALKLVGEDFIDRVVSGEDARQSPIDDCARDEPAMAGDGVTGGLFRCDGVDEQVQRELDKVDSEIIERKKRERDGKAS